LEKGAWLALLRAELIGLLVQEKKRNSNSHRGCLDIIADILEASYGGTKKTYFMYRCNLSFRQLKYYLALLLKKGLLCSVDEGSNPGLSLFRITDKGKEFLKAYDSLKALMN
jgi:predicted transcriptional regulator